MNNKRQSDPVVVPLKPRNKVNSQVESITTAKRLPCELQILMFLHKSTSVSAIAFIGGALILFGLSVSIPKLWSQEYHKLKTLQRQERQLTAANETLRNQLLQQKEAQQTNATYPKPDNALFLSIPSQATQIKSETTEDIKVTQPLSNNLPLGY